MQRRAGYRRQTGSRERTILAAGNGAPILTVGVAAARGEGHFGVIPVIVRLMDIHHGAVILDDAAVAGQDTVRALAHDAANVLLPVSSHLAQLEISFAEERPAMPPTLLLPSTLPCFAARDVAQIHLAAAACRLFF